MGAVGHSQLLSSDASFMGGVAPGAASDPELAEAAACRRLYAAVIWEHLRLASMPRKKTHATSLVEIDRAIAWFGTSGFEEVCALAGFDVDYFRRGLRAHPKYRHILGARR